MSTSEEISAEKDGDRAFRAEFPPLEKVSTTQGDFYTRRIMVKDLKKLSQNLDENTKKEEINLKGLGELSLKVLVSVEDKFPYAPALTEDVYRLLSEDDFKILATSVARACGVGPLPPGDSLESLGSVVFDELFDFIKKQAEQSKRLKEILGKNFGALSSPLQGAIGEHLRQIGSIAEGLRNSPAMQSVRWLQDKYSNPLGDELTSRLQEVARMGRTIGQVGNFRPASDESQSIEFSSVPAIDFAKTPAARAANASEVAAQQLREVAGLTAQMADRLTSLHTLFLTEVFPEWKESLQRSSRDANRSLRHAVWALVVSIVVAIGTTGIQLWVSRQYKLESDAQQVEAERVLRQQLEVLRSLGHKFPQNYAGRPAED